MRIRRVAKMVAIAGAGCVLGAGLAVAAPALAAGPAKPAVAQTKLVAKSGPYGAFAACPAGYSVTGGGFDGTPNPDLDFYSKPALDLSGWAVSGGKGYMTVFAICAPNA